VSGLVFYDDARARRFEPFALTRPVSELRAGALLVRERWTQATGLPVLGFMGATHLEDFEEGGAPSSLSEAPAGSLLVNARFAPALDVLPNDAASLLGDGRLAAIRLARRVDAAELRNGATTLEDLEPERGRTAEVRGWWFDEVWHLLRYLGAMLGSDIPSLSAGLRALGSGETTILGDHAVFVEEGASVEPHVCFDTTLGPVLIQRGAIVQAFTRIVGPCFVGEQSVVTSDRVAGCSIGPHCKVHGEMSATVLLGYANKGHDGFVGHSYLGRWVNLGAGTTTSNLKNTYGTVALWTPDGVRDTGLQFLGTLFGDHSKTGICLPLTTGSVIGAGANVVGRMPGKVVAPFAWGEPGRFETFRVDKFLEVAEKVMGRRSVTLGARTRRQLAASYAARWSE
jgi:UDP-N-acetylglucosamine diphosphorylase/glucosamine-1-phosphate N-acetyltransferase